MWNSKHTTALYLNAHVYYSTLRASWATSEEFSRQGDKQTIINLDPQCRDVSTVNNSQDKAEILAHFRQMVYFKQHSMNCLFSPVSCSLHTGITSPPIQR